MADLITKYLSSLGALVLDISPWLILGFLIAGLIQEFVPARTLLRYFGANDWKSIGRASLAGLAVSVCSCGAIPIAVTLRNKGAATATALTFLLAAPWAGFIQFFILSGFIGAKNTLVIFIFAITVAFISGLILSKLEKFKLIEQKLVSDSILEKEIFIESKTKKFPVRVKKSLYYSWDAFKEMAKYLGIGILLASVLKAFVPTSFVSKYLGVKSSLDPILVAIPVSAAIELCSEGFSIFTGQLYQMGATLGVIFVMMMVGVTTDFTELSVIWGKFGRKSALWYLATATIVAFLAAHIIDWCF
ncbi:MAG TPA: permease [candidate division Zixibacteria bacterium]|nr:permease [candidate division Zixibacteria bacterium]